MIWTILIFIITISVLVTIHELGHFSVARLCGVRVVCFSIGFGPGLVSFKSKSGTKFMISAIPLGGYVKMLDGRVDALTADNRQFAFDQQSITKRAAIISAGPIANFILAFLTYWIIFQIGVASFPIKIAQILPNSVASQTNIVSGAELKSINGIKIEDWQDVRLALVSAIGQDDVEIGYIPAAQSVEKSANIEIKHWQVDLEKEDPISAFGFVPQRPQIIPVLTQVMPGSAAERAGLMVGDRIVRIDGVMLDNWDSLVTLIKKGQSVDLEIVRAGKMFSLSLVPDLRMVPDEKGIEQQQGFAGIVPSSDVVMQKYNPITALSKSLSQTAVMVKVTARSFYQLVTGSLSLKNLSGPVTIAKSAEQSASYGIVAYLYFLGFISISLGIVNLIPLPVLDGGHLLFLLIEKIKGAPLSEKKQALFYRFSFMLLMIVMGFTLYNDFSRL